MVRELGEKTLGQRSMEKRIHYLAQLGTYFSSLSDHCGTFVATSKHIKSPLWNHGAFLQSPSGDASSIPSILQPIAETLRNATRLPCVYLSPSTAHYAKALESEGYRLFDREAWMFFQGGPQSFPPSEFKIAELRDGHDGAAFKAILGQRFPSSYVTAMDAESRFTTPGRLVRHALCKREGEFEGIGSAYIVGAYAVLHNITTIERSERCGIATAVTNHLLGVCRAWGATTVMLQCNAGDHERLYRRCGFETEFVREGYVQASTEELAAAMA